MTPAEQALRDAALEYHRAPNKGKIAVTPTKPLSNQRDLSLAYSPGVAYPCLAIQADPTLAAEYTSRGNLVGVVTNGTAVLGLGDIGPLAGKPVMEGKGCLFKKFAGIDVFDIELAERDPDKLVEIIAALEPTLGGINLEDIKAPECFYIEKQLRERMKIPVFHDDQHGTAIISSAALINGLELVGKQIGEVKIAVSGAGAAAIACLDLMVNLGVKIENILVCDSKGVIHTERADALAGKLDESKQRYCRATPARSLADAAWLERGARVFRLPGIYGPGRSALDRVMQGKAHRIDLTDQVFSRVHVDDIASGVMAGFDGPPGAYNLADDMPCSQNLVIEEACRLLGRPFPPLLTLDEAGLSPVARGFYAENRRIANGKAKRVLGWRPTYPDYRIGLRALSATTSPSMASAPPAAASQDQRPIAGASPEP